MRIGSLFQKLGETTFSRRESDDRIAPPTLGSAVRFPYGPFQFKAKVPKDAPYEILASADLKIWTTLARGTAGADGIEYLDSEAAKFSHRYYRVLAGAVLSLNVIGYAAVTLPPGYSLIANPLDGPSNAIADLFPEWPDGTTLNKFDTRLFRLTENMVKDGKWINPGDQLGPGEGAIFFNPTSDYKSVSFVGDIMQGNLSVPIPSGFSIRSSLVPQPGSIADDLKFPIGEGDVIHIFDRDQQKYVLHPYSEGKWKSGQPIISVGEAFWVAKTSPGNWTRNFSIDS